MNAVEIQSLLKAEASASKALVLQRFFKTGPGEYGEGDKFRGVTMPQQRYIVRFVDKEVDFDAIDVLLDSEYHEDRMTGLLILVKWFEANKKRPEIQTEIFEFYLNRTCRINNWDLVDITAPKIVGAYLVERDCDLLFKLAESESLWEQRIAIVSTWKLIQQGRFLPTLELAERLLSHPHDLMHKAVGWMLREVGKRDLELEIEFLLKDGRYRKMPRTMLRYAIEKFPEPLRLQFLHGEVE